MQSQARQRYGAVYDAGGKYFQTTYPEAVSTAALKMLQPIQTE
ncbi:hypothetical protein [Neisseria musculi]|nr:hypothetical protein [Neisseria musculi]